MKKKLTKRTKMTITWNWADGSKSSMKVPYPLVPSTYRGIKRKTTYNIRINGMTKKEYQKKYGWSRPLRVSR